MYSLTYISSFFQTLLTFHTRIQCLLIKGLPELSTDSLKVGKHIPGKEVWDCDAMESCLLQEFDYL